MIKNVQQIVEQVEQRNPKSNKSQEQAEQSITKRNTPNLIGLRGGIPRQILRGERQKMRDTLRLDTES